MDSTEKNIIINSFTTAQDVCDEILTMVGIDTIHLKEYTLYEVSGEYGMRVLVLC
jgi:Ras association (RalGDS/AF-6) domain